MEGVGQLNSGLVLDKCDILFDCNQFEENLFHLYNDALKFRGQTIQDRFEKHKGLTLSVLEDALGDRMDPFMLQNRPLLLRKRPTAVAFMPRPMWQKLRDNPQCDVESITLKKKTSLPPLERARRRIAEKVYNYQYMGVNAVDVAMLNELRKSQQFLNPLYPQISSEIIDYSAEQYMTVRKFMKMMHARRPIYQLREKHRENYLFYVEYQTSRDCYHILREVRRLRETQNIERLTDYVEHIMSTKIELKTHRTLRWKFQFINEVYNILGLAHIDERAVPKGVDFLNRSAHAILYRLPKDRMRNYSGNFGGRNIYDDMTKDSDRAARASLVFERLEDRLLHSRYGIERAYLMCEIARHHLKESRFGKCVTMARSAAREASECNSLVWRFNACFLICQVHASFNRHERLKDSLLKANHLAGKMRSPALLAYLELCTTVNNYELDFHRNKHADYYWQHQRKRKTALPFSSD
ncbi:hypothetical protein KR093_003115 [Drosophila rubida]|uniref:Uncharacterized protein n=1 Tax=Drosophila rubida TaxID=30044 RepID=A0AAD4KBE0_9MUSC|nr:hypothetical protein KR093_003115 [Drosophila rubida]